MIEAFLAVILVAAAIIYIKDVDQDRDIGPDDL